MIVYFVGFYFIVVWILKYNNQVRVKKKLFVKEGNEMKIVYNIIKLEIIYVMNINRIVLFVIMLFLFREKI